MIFPKTVLSQLDGRYAVVITGLNRSGKTLLALDLAHEYMKAGFRFISNMNCVWNDRLPDIPVINPDTDAVTASEFDEYERAFAEIFPRNFPNADTVFLIDEVGPVIRTKETVRRLMLYKGKLNSIFILPCTELPHEDLLQFVIYPIGFFNPFVRLWIYEIRDIDKKVRRPFIQFFPRSFFGIFSSLNPARDAEFILSWIENCINFIHKRYGQSGLQLRDMATKRSGLGENVGSISQYVAGGNLYDNREIRTSKAGKT